MSGGTEARAGNPAGRQPGRPGFRPDVEGLRAIALLVMLMFHAQLGFAPGGFVGVDVFFVISGFLITRLLINEATVSGTISLARFYAYRMKRLLPLAATVLVSVVVLSQLLLTPAQESGVATDVVSSAFYVVNWHFAAESVDYFAAGYETSPVQHFWTLSIEEQFYIVWPALLLAFTWWWRRRGRSVRPGALLAVATVGLCSLAYGIWFSFDSPNQAYFSTLTRSWDMAMGAFVALLPIPTLRTRYATLLGALGLGAIAIGTFGLDVATPYPGIAALLPAAGAGLFIAAGGSDGRAGLASRALATAPMRFMGRISYAWYLWHWPALVFGGVVLGTLTLGERVALIMGALVPAFLSHRFVEEPFRRAKSLRLHPRRALALGAACTMAALAAAGILTTLRPTVPTLPAGQVLGAAAIANEKEPQKIAKTISPSPLHAGDDRSAMQDDGCLVALEDTKSGRCTYGDESSDTTVVLFGDSLAMQYFPAIQRLAEKRNWRLVGLTKAGCTPAELTVYNHRLERQYDECNEWREDTLQRIEQHEHPDLILISGRITTPVMEDGKILDEQAGLAKMEDGYVRVLERLQATGARVAVIRDLPPSPRNVPNCVSQSLDDLDACTFRPDPAHVEAPDNRAALHVRGVRLIDLTPLVCPRDLCRAVIGNALVYRDFDHMTPTFAATLAPMLAHQLPSLG